ncbi:hypothetical protein KCU77_g63, partial [Aureobasidium melanogenum]
LETHSHVDIYMWFPHGIHRSCRPFLFLTSTRWQSPEDMSNCRSGYCRGTEIGGDKIDDERKEDCGCRLTSIDLRELVSEILLATKSAIRCGIVVENIRWLSLKEGREALRRDWAIVPQLSGNNMLPDIFGGKTGSLCSTFPDAKPSEDSFFFSGLQHSKNFWVRRLVEAWSSTRLRGYNLGPFRFGVAPKTVIQSRTGVGCVLALKLPSEEIELHDGLHTYPEATAINPSRGTSSAGSLDSVLMIDRPPVFPNKSIELSPFVGSIHVLSKPFDVSFAVCIRFSVIFPPFLTKFWIKHLLVIPLSRILFRSFCWLTMVVSSDEAWGAEREKRALRQDEILWVSGPNGRRIPKRGGMMSRQEDVVSCTVDTEECQQRGRKARCISCLVNTQDAKYNRMNDLLEFLRTHEEAFQHR